MHLVSRRYTTHTIIYIFIHHVVVAFVVVLDRLSNRLCTFTTSLLLHRVNS